MHINVLNPAWVDFPNDGSGVNGGLFIRLAKPTTSGSVICLLPTIANTQGLSFATPGDSCVLKDGPPGTPQQVAIGMDPRAVHRKITGEYFVLYQTGWNSTRRTQISSSMNPSDVSTWKRFPKTMFDINDCGTALWFPDDDDATIPQEKKRVLAVATFGTLRGGNLSLVASTDGMQTWDDLGVFLYTRPNHWDNATLSSGPSPMALDDGNWLMLYNVDNLWPVVNPKPLPSFGRCALGWAILDKNNLTHVLARAEEPFVFAEMPWEKYGSTNMVVYTDGMRSEGNNTFTVFAGGADTVVEAFRIQVEYR